MTSNHYTIHVKKENNIVKNVKVTFHHLAFILHYTTLNNYYIVQNTFT